MHDYLDEFQIKAVLALEELDRICKKHDICFFLLAGSCLGGVRHQGMIPWDDDIDTGFLYEDLQKLKNVITAELNTEFQYVSYDVAPGFPRLFGKILYNGRSCVDLFLIAKWTTNTVNGYIHWEITRFCVESYYKSIGYNKHHKGKKCTRRRLMRTLRCVVRHLFFWLKTEDYLRVARWNEKYFDYHNGDCYINLYSVYGMKKEIIQKEYIEKPNTILFEGNYYRTCGSTDAYLQHLYGKNYMKPPSKKRIKKNAHAEVYEIKRDV